MLGVIEMSERHYYQCGQCGAVGYFGDDLRGESDFSQRAEERIAIAGFIRGGLGGTHGFTVPASAMIAARICSGNFGQIAASAVRSAGISAAGGAPPFVDRADSSGVCVADMWRGVLQFRSLFFALLLGSPETTQGTPFPEMPCGASLCASLRGDA